MLWFWIWSFEFKLFRGKPSVQLKLCFTVGLVGNEISANQLALKMKVFVKIIFKAKIKNLYVLTIKIRSHLKIEDILRLLRSLIQNNGMFSVMPQLMLEIFLYYKTFDFVGQFKSLI